MDHQRKSYYVILDVSYLRGLRSICMGVYWALSTSTDAIMAAGAPVRFNVNRPSTTRPECTPGGPFFLLSQHIRRFFVYQRHLFLLV